MSELNCCVEWKTQIDRVLFTEEQINTRIKELATQISEKYKGKKLLCVGLLNGAFVFVANLLKYLTIQYEVDFMCVSSYGNSTTSSGSVKLKKDMSIDPKDRHILIIEDLIDTGNTLHWLQGHLENKNCASVSICCLLDKKVSRSINVHIDFTGFECGNEFVIGYGMDYANEYRCLPFIGVLKLNNENDLENKQIEQPIISYFS
jgi:hypoxanthine phosphoribosyltransferase